jgi:hypothetical protein
MKVSFRAWLFRMVFILGLVSPGLALSQVDTEEAYDPFSDYSEFDEASDEEADINFFRNGRFLTVGLAAGPQTFTGGMAKSYAEAPVMGLNLSYFFDLRLALTLGLMTSDHSVKIRTTTQTYTGNVGFSELNLHLKYYVSTQNLIKGLADLNPYFVGGFSQVTRSYSIAELQEDSRETVTSSDIGVGIEIPVLRRKSFFGFQAVYHYVNFNDESKGFINAQPLLQKVNGDYMNLQFILGMNF